MGRTDIGRKLQLTSVLLPFLYIGVTFAFLRLSGNVLLSMLRFNTLVKGLVIAWAAIFWYLALILSMPVALFTLRFCS